MVNKREQNEGSQKIIYGLNEVCISHVQHSAQRLYKPVMRIIGEKLPQKIVTFGIFHLRETAVLRAFKSLEANCPPAITG